MKVRSGLVAAGAALLLSSTAAPALAHGSAHEVDDGSTRTHERVSGEHRGMVRMHERMMSGEHRGMVRMHERMMSGEHRGIVRMHEQCASGASVRRASSTVKGA